MVIMHPFSLHPYQIECIETIEDNFRILKSQLVQLPTGAGKTVILWSFLNRNPGRALIIAPTVELTEQIETTGQRIVDPKQIWRKKTAYLPKSIPQYIVMTHQASTWSMKQSWIDDVHLDYLIIDEAHRSGGKNLKSFIHEMTKRGVKVLGLTATPERRDKQSLLEMYDELTFERSFYHLIKDGYLADLRCYRIQTHHIIEKWNQSKDIPPNVLKTLNTRARNELIWDLIRKKCKKLKTLIFCLNVEDAKFLAMVTNALEVGRAAAIDGSMSSAQRHQILSDFKTGKIDKLFNCQLLTEGFDEPSIEALILARPTLSKALYCQMIGRGVRKAPGKEHCMVYDLGYTNHNICSFNVLMSDEENLRDAIRFEIDDGESFKDAAIRHEKKKEADYVDIDYVLSRHNLIEGLESLSLQPYQEEELKSSGFPLLWPITFTQGAYILFKCRELKKHGYDPKAYFKRWCNSLSMCHQAEGDEGEECKL